MAADDAIVPICVVISPLTVLTAAVRVQLAAGDFIQHARLLRVYGHLNALISGAVTINLLAEPGNVQLAQVNWTAAGNKSGIIDYDILDVAGGIQLDVTSIGVGAGQVTIVMWFQLRF
jgi:hypothetical protein